jgi:RNA polymerase sigma-70 factor (ECF subfamily)
MNKTLPGTVMYPANGAVGEFTTTHWSVVLEACQVESPQGADALEQLCRTYWYPLYAFVRRKGYSPADAQDLTQDFFARLLEKKYIALADRSRGRFRTFLLTSLQHFLANEWAKAKTERRGGGHQIISWEEDEAEERYLAEPADNLAPDKIFERRWATGLLELVLARLREEYTAAAKSEQFETLKVFVWGEKSLASYAEIAGQLRMSEGAVKVAVYRLRQRYRELLRAQVARTVASESEVDEELRYLISTLSS